MPINNIPGVGPSNADVANAVAAVVPDSADITAAVPTAAQIATAVAAPSAATIAAAVAAPSSATIASAVAAAVPTIGAITSVVQANAGSPYGGTLTSLGAQSFNGASSLTFSSLSGYKTLQFYITGVSPNNTNTDFNIRFNSDASNYAYFLPYWTNTAIGRNYSYTSSAGLIGAALAYNNNSHYFSGEIRNSNSSSYKVCSINGWYVGISEGRYVQNGWTIWNNSAAINSITFFFNQPATNDANARVYLLGGN